MRTAFNLLALVLLFVGLHYLNEATVIKVPRAEPDSIQEGIKFWRIDVPMPPDTLLYVIEAKFVRQRAVFYRGGLVHLSGNLEETTKFIQKIKDAQRLALEQAKK